MEIISHFFNMLLHVDKYMGSIIANYGIQTYLIIFLIIFCETGLVVTPFLPGDSLLFALGAFAAIGKLNIAVLILVLSVAAILGDTANYHIGKYLGPKVFERKNSRIFKKEYLDKTNEFYEKYGGKTIIIARYIPIVRTFAPFVAGIGSMSYKKFISYNIVGGILWVGAISLSGYFFGNLPFIQENFSMVVYAIVVISVLPAIIEFLKHKFKSKK